MDRASATESVVFGSIFSWSKVKPNTLKSMLNQFLTFIKEHCGRETSTVRGKAGKNFIQKTEKFFSMSPA